MLSKQKISDCDLDKILKKFDLGKIISMEPVATSGNVSYLIKTNSKSYFLRLCPAGPRFRSTNEILAEIELLHHLKNKDFPVLIPIRNKEGGEIISLKNHNGYIREFLDNCTKDSPDSEEIEKFGGILGQFHLLVENFNTKYRREHIFDLEATKNYFKEKIDYIANSNFKNKEKFISKVNANLLSMDFPESLPSGTIHEDLGKRHVLWDKNKISAIIDFDRSYCGKIILDIGEACRGWCFVNNWNKWSNENFEHLIKGYCEKRKLSEFEKKFLVDAIKFAIIERGIAFCLRYLERTNDPEDEEYALFSVSDDGLLGMLEKNKDEIEKILIKI